MGSVPTGGAVAAAPAAAASGEAAPAAAVEEAVSLLSIAPNYIIILELTP